MGIPALDLLSPTASAVRSGEGYVVPRFVEVTAGAHAIVTSLAVAPRDVVHRGQTIATVEQLGAGGDGRRRQVSIQAPVTGLVTRRWAKVGDVVAGAWPILSIASSHEVMVAARFPSRDAAHLRRGASASVLLRGAARATVPGTIVSVVDAPEADAGRGEADRRACVVVSLAVAPPGAVWPGSGARVDIA
jgi:multidrug resistance efflux pump